MSQVNWGALAKEAGDISPVPVGKYNAIITKAELKTSATSNNDYWQCVFKIQDGPQAGRTLYNNFVLVEGNPNALRAFFINMGNLGITQDQLVSLGGDKNAVTPLLVGRQALVTVGHREYQGQMRDSVERIDKHPSGPIGNAGGGLPSAGGAPAPSSAPVPSAAPVPPAPAAAPIPTPAAPAAEASDIPVPPAPPALPF